MPIVFPDNIDRTVRRSAVYDYILYMRVRLLEHTVYCLSDERGTIKRYRNNADGQNRLLNTNRNLFAQRLPQKGIFVSPRLTRPRKSL